MFYFLFNIITYYLLIIIIYYYFSKKRISILDFLIILFLFNMYFLFLLKDINIIVAIIMTLIIILIKNLYEYLYNINNSKISKDNVFIKNGMINFKGLIANNYSYNKLISNLKRKGIKNILSIDYCALYNNDLIVFQSNIKNYPVSLIVDGNIMENNLVLINKNSNWLNNEIINNNLELKRISYAFYKDNNLYFLVNGKFLLS